MNTDEKIVKMLEGLQADVKKQGTQLDAVQTEVGGLKSDVTAIKGEVVKIPAIEKRLDQHGKILTGLADNMATVLTEQQAQRIDIRSLHTEVHASKEELKSEILSARAEARADSIDVKAAVMKPLKDHEKRIDALEDAAGIPHPDEN